MCGLCSGEAVSHGLIGKAMVSELFLVVALTMALTPLLAEIGQRLGKAFEKSDVKVSTFVSSFSCMQTVMTECAQPCTGSKLCILLHLLCLLLGRMSPVYMGLERAILCICTASQHFLCDTKLSPFIV